MNVLPTLSLEQRLERLEERLDEFSQTLRRIETALSAGRVPEVAVAPKKVEDGEPGATVAELLPSHSTVLDLLTQIGRSCLVLCGAFLVRALTDSGTLPRRTGVALGVAYAVFWVLFADRVAGKGRRRSGAFLATTALVIAYPLVWETATRFGVLTPVGAAVGLVALTGLLLAVSWRRNLPSIAWFATIAAIVTGSGLSIATDALELFAAAMLLIGLATAWLAYGERQWRGVRWLAALAADLFVLWMALRMTSAGGAARSVPLFFVIAFALPCVYLGSFALQTLALRRDVTIFEALQTFAAVLVGFGGAVAVAHGIGRGQTALGSSALVVALGSYAVAFAFVQPHQGSGRNFFFYATLALVFTLTGSALVIEGAALGFLWSLLALAAILLRGRWRKKTLSLHCATYAAFAAWQTGLLAATVDTLATSPLQNWSRFSASGVFALATSAACYALLVRGGNSRSRSGVRRFSCSVLLVIAAFGTAALTVAALRGSGWLLPEGDFAAVAALRSAVLAAAAVLLALARRRLGLSELGWLSWTLLVLGGAKILLEDLPGGRPVTLFLAFAFYGAALLSVPRLLRRSAAGLVEAPPAA